VPSQLPSTGERNKARWQRIRAQHKRREPLCRMCLAEGKTVVAEVVDHIRSLTDGGDHSEHNLQSLCKRCHDTIKTPLDRANRKQRNDCTVAVRAVWYGDEAPANCVDARVFRRDLQGRGMRCEVAHQLALAAVEGIVMRCVAMGALSPVSTIVCDDCAFCCEMREKHNVGCQILLPETENVYLDNETDAMQRFLMSKRGLEWELRKAKIGVH